MRTATGSSGCATATRTGRPDPAARHAVPGPLDAHRGRALIPGGETSAPWRAVLERLRHPDVWGPGGLYPLDAFRRTGRGWVARCPGGAHPDRHPSFSMPDARSFGHCFACGYRRTWIGFVLERQGHSPDARGPAFRSALATLAERAGMPLDEPARSQDAKLTPPPLAVLVGILKRGLLSDHPRAAACRAYLGSRSVPDAMIPRLPIGAWTETGAIGAALRVARLPAGLLREHGLLARYIPSHPLLFFYEDTDGVTGFKCRKPVVGEKSVLNALGFGGDVEGRSLFGVSVAGEAIARYCRAILVEGEFDALGWYAASLAVGRSLELVALGGSAKPTVEKFRTLRTLGARVVYLALDADAAGDASTAAACRCAWKAALNVAVLAMPPDCKDPDEVLARHGATRGAQQLFALDRAEPAAAWLARYQLRRCPPVTVEQAAALREASAEAARLMPVSARAQYGEIVAEALGVPARILEVDWERHATTARARDMRDRLHRWALDWAGRLEQTSLAEHLDEASTLLRAARAELGTSMDNHPSSRSVPP
jgi:DNA primase